MIGIGSTIESREPFPVSAVAWFALALALVAASFLTKNNHLWIAAALPLGFSAAMWFKRPTPVVYAVERDRLVEISTGREIRYEEIRTAMIANRRFFEDAPDIPDGAIEIYLADGRRVSLPHGLNLPSNELYRFLMARIPPRPVKPVHPSLTDYVNEQVAKFGNAMVQVVHARETDLAAANKGFISQRVWVALMLVGIFWIAVGIAFASQNRANEDYYAWSVFGIMICSIFGLIGLLQFASRGNSSEAFLKKHSDACIVISPAGFAMVQGDTRGAIHWHEIVRVSSKPSQFLRASRVAGVQVVVAGGDILIQDIYELSTTDLEATIRRNLAPQRKWSDR